MIAKIVLSKKFAESVNIMGLRNLEKMDDYFKHYLGTISGWDSNLKEKKNEEQRRLKEQERKRRERISSQYDFSKKESHYLDNKPWL